MFKNFCVCSCCDDAGVGCGGTVAVAAVLKTAAGVALLGSVADGRLENNNGNQQFQRRQDHWLDSKPMRTSAAVCSSTFQAAVTKGFRKIMIFYIFRLLAFYLIR